MVLLAKINLDPSATLLVNIDASCCTTTCCKRIDTPGKGYVLKGVSLAKFESRPHGFRVYFLEVDGVNCKVDLSAQLIHQVKCFRLDSANLVQLVLLSAHQNVRLSLHCCPFL